VHQRPRVPAPLRLSVIAPLNLLAASFPNPPSCHQLSQVCTWVNGVATKPVWAKMTPNITDITVPAKAALDAGRVSADAAAVVCVLGGEGPQG
jgi:hypothetical protein